MTGSAGRVELTGMGGTDLALAEWIEELAERLQAGEPLDLEACVHEHPEWADRLLQLAPAIQMLADLGRSAEHDKAPTWPEEPEPVAGVGILGDFRILREVGRGGMGVVYEAQQLSLNRRVALKILPFAAAIEARQLQRFQIEAQAAACLHHTNIVPVHAVGSERGVPFYAMQFIDGSNLAGVIAELRRLEGLDPARRPTELAISAPAARLAGGHPAEWASGPRVPGTAPGGSRLSPGDGEAQMTTAAWSSALAPLSSGATPRSGSSTCRRDYIRKVAEMGVQVAEALDHAHTRGILHRDIKPANLLLDAQGQLWVTDFGLAQIQGNPGLTVTGDFLGTLRYMSPEQALARRVVIDGRTDIYSLGVTLYELLTLRPAVEGTDRVEVLRRIADEEPLPPRRLNPTVPRDLETIILKAMDKEPGGRYATAKELADELRRFLEYRPIVARRSTWLGRAGKLARRHRQAVWAVGVSLAILLMSAVVGLAISNFLIARERNQKVTALKQREAALVTAGANLQLARKAVDDVYDQFAEKIRDLPQMQSLEREFLEKALNYYREFANQKGTDPVIRLGTGRAYERLGLIQFKLNQHRQAEESLTMAVARLEELVAQDSTEPRYRSELAASYDALGLVLTETKGSRQAEQAHRCAIKILSELVAEGVPGPELRIRLATANNSLGTLLHARPAEAESAYRDAIILSEKLVNEFPEKSWFKGELVRSHFALGRARAEAGRFLDAEKSLRDAIRLYQQKADPLNSSYYRRLLPVAYLELAKVMHSLGRLQDSKDAYQESIVLWERYVAGFPRISEYWVRLYDCYAKLASLLDQTGHTEEAEKVCRRALDLYKTLTRQLPDEIADEGVLRIATGLDAVLKNRSYPQDQERGYREALEFSDELAARSPTLVGYRFHAAYWHNALGGLMMATSRSPEATSAYRSATAQYRVAIELNPNHLPSLKNLAWILATAPDPQLREPQSAVLLAERAVGLTPTSANTWSILGAARYRAGDHLGALTALEKSEALGHGRDFGFNAVFIAMARWQLGERDEARRGYEKALEWMKSRPNDEELGRFRSEADALLRPPEPAVSPHEEHSSGEAEGHQSS
jgi:tetratricopeptide (TPR) repeat protein